MDYLTKIDHVITVLEEHGFSDFAIKIALLRDTASTGSELIMSVTHELLQIADQHTQLKTLIGNDTQELTEFCWSIGLKVR